MSIYLGSGPDVVDEGGEVPGTHSVPGTEPGTVPDPVPGIKNKSTKRAAQPVFWALFSV